jgi:hypothetical protein
VFILADLYQNYIVLEGLYEKKGETVTKSVVNWQMLQLSDEVLIWEAPP